MNESVTKLFIEQLRLHGSINYGEYKSSDNFLVWQILFTDSSESTLVYEYDRLRADINDLKKLWAPN